MRKQFRIQLKSYLKNQYQRKSMTNVKGKVMGDQCGGAKGDHLFA